MICTPAIHAFLLIGQALPDFRYLYIAKQSPLKPALIYENAHKTLYLNEAIIAHFPPFEKPWDMI